MTTPYRPDPRTMLTGASRMAQYASDHMGDQPLVAMASAIRSIAIAYDVMSDTPDSPLHLALMTLATTMEDEGMGITH